MECAIASVDFTVKIVLRQSALADCFTTLLLEHVFLLVRAAILRILTTLLAINVPHLVSSVSASLPFALVAFPQSQLHSTTITAPATVHALLVLLQADSTVPYAIVPLFSAPLAVFQLLTVPLVQLVIFRNLYLAPVLLVAQLLAHIQSVIKSTRSVFPLVQITWYLSTSETTSIRVSTAPIALINSPPLHLVSPPAPIISMLTALSGSALNVMPVALPVTADTQKIAPHALQPPPFVTCC